MRTRPVRGVAVAAALALLSVPAVTTGTAHAVTTNNDDFSADKSARINNIPMKLRVLKPTSGGPYPLVIYIAGSGSRCGEINDSTSWLTRKQLAEAGYVVVSFNVRGRPASMHGGLCAGSTQATMSADVQDGLDDSGSDLGGPVDQVDVKEVIDWVLETECDGACDNLVDTDDIAVIGERTEATRAVFMPGLDSRVKAVVPVGFRGIQQHVAALSSTGSNNTPSAIEQGYYGFSWAGDHGHMGHNDPQTLAALEELGRGAYVPTVNYRAYISSGSAVVNLVSGPPYFRKQDENRGISIAGAGGSATTTMWSAIQTVNSPTQATLWTNASSTVLSTNPRQAAWLGVPANRNPTGTLGSLDNTVVLASGTQPTFERNDVGGPITIAAAAASGKTLSTVITAVSDDGLTATLQDASASGVSLSGNGNVRWGPAAWLDQRTLVDDDASVDKTWQLTSKKVFFVNGFLDGESGTQMAIEAWKKLKTAGNTDAYIYVGACGVYPAPCGATNAGWLRAKVIAFLDKYLKNVAGSIGGPVFHLVPAKASGTPPTNADDTWAPADTWVTGGAATDASDWPPTGISTSTYCMNSNATWSTPGTGGSCTPTSTSTRTVYNRDDVYVSGTNVTEPIAGFCVCLNNVRVGYLPNDGEAISYTSSAFTGADKKLYAVEVELSASNNTSRMQLYFDLFEVRGTTEIPIWHGAAQTVPTARHQAPGNTIRFKFKPSGGAWTIQSGSTLRVKLATNNRTWFANEVIGSWTTVLHAVATPFKVHLTMT